MFLNYWMYSDQYEMGLTARTHHLSYENNDLSIYLVSTLKHIWMETGKTRMGNMRSVKKKAALLVTRLRRFVSTGRVSNTNFTG